MIDLNTMMRDQARAGLEAQLATAVTEGNQDAATKIAGQLATLAVQTAPKAPPYGDTEIRNHLDKLPWFGTDPKKSAKAIEFGKTLDPKKFATAEAFAAAVAKAVDDEFKPAAKVAEPPENETDEEREDREAEEEAAELAAAAAAEKKNKARRTDGPGEADGGTRVRRTSGPWTKLADAPKEVQAEVKRQADKFVRPSASKEERDRFVAKALESHYAAHQRTNKGKK